MQFSKEEVLSIITTQPNGNIEEKNFKKKYSDHYQELLKINFPSDFTFSQKLYHYLYNDPDLKLGLCLTCGKRCNYIKFGKGYHIFCSKSCTSHNINIIQKKRNTCLKKYGSDWSSKSDIIKNKSKETCLEKYGVEFYLQSEDKKIKSKNTCLEKYGVENYTQSDEFINKFKQTCLKKYGVENPSQNKEISKKQKSSILKTFNKIYGVNCITHIPGVIEKYEQTCLEKYGVKNYSQTHEFAKYHRKRIKYNNLTFDSSWEIEVYKFCKENNISCEYQPNIQFEYEYDGKKHIYQPDFLINGKVYEVKGDQFFENDKMICPFDRSKDDLFESKYQCMIKNGIIILRKDDILNLKEVLL